MYKLVLKIQILFLLWLLFNSDALAQQRLKDLRNKTSGQVANSANGIRMDSTFFIARIGVLGRSLTEAVQEHALTPYDFATLQVAKDTSSARRFPLIVPWNYTASALTFKDADSAMVLFNYGTINITASDTIPAGAHILMMRSGRFNISAGVTLRINAQFNGERKRAFYGGGAVRFGNAAVEEIYPEWFGAANDSVTTISDSGPAFKAAIDAAPNDAVILLANGSRSLATPKGYVINTTVRFPSDRSITMRGNGSVIYSSAADTVLYIQNGSQTAVPSYAISPTTSQPRHVVEGILFKRIAGATGTGVAIALTNSTGQTFNNVDISDYNNGFVFHNISDGWCENNEIFNSRIAGCDTAISYMLSQSGNNSMATNSLRKVTITRFTDSDVINQGAGQAVGIFGDTGTNFYRNVWDQVVLFPKDSVTCVNIDGRAEDLTGTINFEYIGSTETVRMRGFHFGTNSSELRFRLHMNLTGRRYFDEPNIFYSQIPGSFGYTGITTTLDGNQNHGIETVVDSSKFTTLFSVIRNSRLGMTTPADSARIFFANVNNSADGKLDLRARRNAPIEIRSYTDNVYSSPTTNSVGGSALPLHPVRLLDIGTNRSITNAGVAADSQVVDVRNTTYLLFGSGTATIDSLTRFRGGIVGHVLNVQFTDDSTIVTNLSGGTGSGRLFLKDNRNLQSVAGLRMEFIAETETAGVGGTNIFWRERKRIWPDDINTISDNDPTPEAGKYAILRLSNSGGTSITDFLNDQGLQSGRFGKTVTLVFLNGNTTIVHNASKIVLAGTTNFTGATNDVMVLFYDGTTAVWRELSRTGSAAAPVVGTVDSTNIVNLGVAAGDLSNASVLNAKIANSAVDSNKVKASHITSTDIKNAEVLNADIADGAVSPSKFSSTVIPTMRAKIGWTTQTSPVATDTSVTRYRIDAANAELILADADTDSLIMRPQGTDRYVFKYKDGAGNPLMAVDSLGYVYTNVVSNITSSNMLFGDPTNTTTIAIQTDGTGDGELTVPGLSINTAEITGDAIDSSKVANGSLIGADIRVTTVTPSKLTAAARTRTFSVGLIDTVKAADVLAVVKVPFAITITEVSAFTNTGTATLQVEKRAEATPNTSGTTLLSSSLVADNDQQETTSFATAAVAADQWVVVVMSAVSGGAQRLNVTIRYTVD